MTTLADIMWTARLRYSGLGLLLLVVTGSVLLAWLRLSVVGFAAIVGAIVFTLGVLVAARDTWRQTSTENLAARGIVANDRTLPVYDPGLRRELGG